MSLFYKFAQKEHSLKTRIVALLPAGLLFLILLPYVIVSGGSALDRLLGWQPIRLGVVNYIIGAALLVLGLFFALWSILVQIDQGRGTPLPMLPTQELLIGGPFRYCRNPMTLGTILAYLGIGVCAGTIAGIGLVLCFGLLLVLYLKHFEEKELAERFGEAYLSYKQEVPFIIPRLPRRTS